MDICPIRFPSICHNTALVKAKNLIVAIFCEIYSMVYSGALGFQGYRRKYTYCGANPTKLSAEDAKNPAVFITHGYKGHQHTAKKLIKALMKTRKYNVFTVNLDYDYKKPSAYRRKLIAKIEGIRDMYLSAGQDMHLSFVGHSQGATDSSRLAYCKLIKKPIDHCTVEKVVSIAGPLRASKGCHKPSIPLYNKIQEGIKKYPEIPLYNVVSLVDWIVPLSAQKIQTDPAHCFEKANKSHLGILFDADAINAVIGFLK